MANKGDKDNGLGKKLDDVARSENEGMKARRLWKELMFGEISLNKSNEANLSLARNIKVKESLLNRFSLDMI